MYALGRVLVTIIAIFLYAIAIPFTIAAVNGRQNYIEYGLIYSAIWLGINLSLFLLCLLAYKLYRDVKASLAPSDYEVIGSFSAKIEYTRDHIAMSEIIISHWMLALTCSHTQVRDVDNVIADYFKRIYAYSRAKCYIINVTCEAFTYDEVFVGRQIRAISNTIYNTLTGPRRHTYNVTLNNKYHFTVFEQLCGRFGINIASTWPIHGTSMIVAAIN